jgi:hypothetical protein
VEVPTFVESESLKEQRMQEACWRTLCAKNEGQYKDFCEDLKKMEESLKDLEKRTVFCELQCNALANQLLSLKKKGSGFVLQPHPLVYPSESVDRKPDFIKINPCVCCKGLFPHIDIVVSTCRHLYHLWWRQFTSNCTRSAMTLLVRLGCPQSGISALVLVNLTKT